MFKLYTKNNCMQCKMTKRWLEEHEIDFIQANISTDEQAHQEAIETGFKTVPLLTKDGRVVVSGFQPSELSKL